MPDYQSARIVIGIFLTIFTFIIPLVVTAIPLVSVIRLTRLQQVRKSIWLLSASTVVSSVIGLLMTGLAIMICGSTMAYGRSGDGPDCNFGPFIFFPVGIFFTILTFGVGLYFTGKQVVKNVNESARKGW